MSADKQLNNLIEFRQAAYQHMNQAHDALFELSDALMVTPSVPSLAHLALSPLFRRKWPSVYEALQDGKPDREELLRLYATHVQSSEYPTLSQPRVLLAGDHTAWPRPSARTLAQRTYQHQPTQIPGIGNRPVTAGHGYSTLAWVPQDRGSWALPLLHERIAAQENALDKACSQLSRSVGCLPDGLEAVAMYDSQYGCAPFVQATATVKCDKLLRLRPNLRLFEAPPPYKGRGPRPKHGAPFKLKDPSTWGVTDEVLWTDDRAMGWVLVQMWSKLHFRASPAQAMTLIRISRPGARGSRRDPKAQWLAWVGFDGKDPPPLQEWWKLYGRRFALDHWYRFAKQRLHWTKPQLSTAQQCEVWSDLMPMVMWELWLAKGVVVDCPLPWHKPQPLDKQTPGRVCEGMSTLITKIGTPARCPKPRGKSSGWPTGKARRCRERHPVLKKGKKAANTTRASPKNAA